MSRKAMQLREFISTHRQEWLQHRAMYNEVITSLHDRFKRTCRTLNSDIKKCHNQLQKKDGEVLAAKSKLVIAKTEVSSVKKSFMERSAKMGKNNEVSVRKLRHKKNLLSTKIRKLETELKKRDGEKPRTEEESL
uniref:Uncharacterized protein n=1 Tax=Corethron hystrix TaxID=216773 RepID=A0A6U5HP08_9STRA|mmetsp:Transcript_31112/g.71150  ORF Transcript_31112/g.71150 Transcript_31112/m.71150 type:complete len:135 (+) Transcript_31112:779-1183(+)